MFIPKKGFLVDFFVQEEGEGSKNPRDLNTLQEETNKFQVKTSNLNLIFFPSFDV
jgi:hypothetical protein